MAKARKHRAGGKAPGPRKVIAQLKASEEFGAWFDRMLVALRLPAPVVLEHALIAYAKAHGFDEPAPER